MPTLRELQGEFARSVLDPGRAAPEDVTSHTARRPKRRFAVYRNNVYFSLIEALAAQYPAVARLLGRELFTGIAKSYIGAHPPRSPILFLYGEDFPEFLEAAEPLKPHPYLGDVARLEWRWIQAYHAADAAPMSAQALGEIPPEDLVSTRFTLHPSCGLVSSPFPVVTIWEANVGDGEVGPIDAGSGGEDALIVRPGLEVEVRRLSPGARELISALGKGAALGEASERAAGANGGFDLQLALTQLIESRAIIAAAPDGSAASR